MATTQIVFGFTAPGNQADFPAINASDPGTVAQTFTPSGTNQQTTNSTTAGVTTLVRVATDTLVYVSFGTAPNASTDAIRFLCPANTTQHFFVGPSLKAAVST